MVLAVIVVAACGGGSDESSRATTKIEAATTTEVATTTTEDPRPCGGEFTRNCYEQAVIDAELAHYGGELGTPEEEQCIAAAVAATLTDADLKSWVEDVIDAGNAMGPNLSSTVVEARTGALYDCDAVD